MPEVLHRLLIVEDNEADVFLIRKALEEYAIPAIVTVVSDGEGAAALCDSREPDSIPEAIILDLDLPRIDGLEVLARMRASVSFARIPVMVFTSSPAPGDRYRAESMGNVRYVEKSINLDAYVRDVGDNVNAMLGRAAHRAGS